MSELSDIGDINSFTAITTTLSIRNTHTGTTPITQGACLHFISRHASLVNRITFYQLATAQIFIHKASDLSAKEIRASLARAFSSALANGRSRRQEFTKMSRDMAQHEAMKVLVKKAIQLPSLEAAVIHMADEFAKHGSVAQLARHYGTKRSSGKHKRSFVLSCFPANAQQSFLLWLRKAVELLETAGERPPLSEAVEILRHAAADVQVTQLIKQLLPHTTDKGMLELRDIVLSTLHQRQARSQRQ